MENEDLQQLTIDTLRAEIRLLKANQEKADRSLEDLFNENKEYQKLVDGRASYVVKLQRINSTLRQEIECWKRHFASAVPGPVYQGAYDQISKDFHEFDNEEAESISTEE